MKITLRELLEKEASLVKLLDAELPAKAGYHAGKAMKAIIAELDTFNEVRNKLIAKYGEDIPKGEEGAGNRRVKKENLDTFNEEINPLLDEEIELKTKLLNIDEFKGATLKTRDIMNLTGLIIKE